MSYLPFYLSINAQDTNLYHNTPCTGDTPVLTATGDDAKVYELPHFHAEVTVQDTVTASGVHRVETSVTNRGETSLCLDAVSSLFVGDIGDDLSSERAVFDRRFLLHEAPGTWQGEAQWTHGYVEDLGLYSTYNHNHMTAIRRFSVGTWSTGVQYPLFLLEDTLTHECWFFEIETGTGWYVECDLCGVKAQAAIGVMLSGAFEANDGWHCVLAPGKTYTAVPAVWGRVKGGFEEAIAALTRYKRADALVPLPNGEPPAVFNEYMNSLWAQPTLARELPLIEAAKRAGCEVYVMDAGWFGNDAWYACTGNWTPNDKLFGEGGLRAFIARIAAAGMQPGIWLEMESIHPDTPFAAAHPDCLLTRHGHVINAHHNAFLDFRRAEVRAYLSGVVDDLYAMGVRYIKNDYNHTVGVGIDGAPGESLAEALRRENDCFLAFIDELTQNHPGLMIENCGSGGMRCDHATLSHFFLQSSSDQEFYDRVPSIVQGLSACIPPERIAVWPTPCAVLYDDMARGEDPALHEALRKRNKSGWETAVNMVSGMSCLMLLSGRIDLCDEKNAALVADGVALYKKYRAARKNAVPVYPEGIAHMRDDGWSALGSLAEDTHTLLLSVWKLRTTESSHTLDLRKYIPADAVLADVYPRLPGASAELSQGRLTLTLPAQENAAAWVAVTW